MKDRDLTMDTWDVATVHVRQIDKEIGTADNRGQQMDRSRKPDAHLD